MRSVAGAEPAAVIACFADGDTAQVRADAEQDQPFGPLDAVAVRLGVAQALPFGVFGRVDFVLGAVADEDGFAAPFDDDLFHGRALGSGIECRVVSM